MKKNVLTAIFAALVATPVFAVEPGDFASGINDDRGEKNGWESFYGGDPDGGEGTTRGWNDGWSSPKGLTNSLENGRIDNGAGNGGEGGSTKYGEDGGPFRSDDLDREPQN